MTTYPMKLTCTKCGATDEGTLHIPDESAREWVGLTDGELNDLYATHHDKFGQPISSEHNGWGYERAIETKLREKNA